MSSLTVSGLITVAQYTSEEGECMLTLSPDDNQLSVHMSNSISVLYCSDTHIFVIFIYSEKILGLFFF